MAAAELFNIFQLLTPKSNTTFLSEKNTIRQAIEVFDVHKFSVLSILNKQGEYVSTISEGDILRYIKNSCNFDISKAESKLISEIEHYRPYTSININATIEEIYDLILSQNYIPVVDDRKKYIGIITRKDVLLLLEKKK